MARRLNVRPYPRLRAEPLAAADGWRSLAVKKPGRRKKSKPKKKPKQVRLPFDGGKVVSIRDWWRLKCVTSGYGDNRDLVKWGTLIHLARRDETSRRSDAKSRMRNHDWRTYGRAAVRAGWGRAVRVHRWRGTTAAS